MEVILEKDFLGRLTGETISVSPERANYLVREKIAEPGKDFKEIKKEKATKKKGSTATR